MKRGRRGSMTIASLCVCGLTACATAQRVELDPSAPSRIRRIVLLKVAEPPTEVVNEGGVGAAIGGLLGGLLQSGANQSATDSYAGLMARQGVSFAPALTAQLTDAMIIDGYVVEVRDAPLTANRKEIDLDAVPASNADAILAVSCKHIGYVSPPSSTDYVPWVLLQARLVDARSRSELYNKTFSGGYAATIQNAVQVPSDKRFRYGSMRELKAGFAESVQGIQKTGRAIVARIQADLAPEGLSYRMRVDEAPAAGQASGPGASPPSGDPARGVVPARSTERGSRDPRLPVPRNNPGDISSDVRSSSSPWAGDGDE